MIRWQDLTARGRGLHLHVRRVVDPDAPPVLLLHGLGVGGSVWQAFARRLTPHLAAVAPDLRGHGQSDTPADGYTPLDYASDIAELIEDLQLSLPVPLVGHSLGALVGLALADAWPEHVQWLALLDPPLDPERRNRDVPQVFALRHAPEGELERYLQERNPRGGALLAQLLATLFRQASDAAFEAMLRPDDPSGRRAPAVVSAAWEQAARLRAPCMLLQADPDYGGLLGDAAAEALMSRVPNGTKLKIEGATHALHASHPAEVAQAILGFGGYA